MSSDNPAGVGGGRVSNNTLSKVLLIIVALLLVFSIYQVAELSTLQNQLSSSQAQNSNLQAQLTNLQDQLANVESQIQSLSSPARTGPNEVVSVKLSNVCLGQTPSCNGTYVYAMNILNNGNATIPANYSVFLSFKDSTILSAFAFNATIGSNGPLSPGQSTLLLGTSWPKYQNGTSIAKLNPGDTVGMNMLVGSFSTGMNVQVQGGTTSTSTSTP